MPLFVFNYKIPNDSILKKVCLIFSLYLAIPGLSAQDLKSHWVDSVFQTLSPQEKIGQLFMIPISSYADPGEMDELKRQIKVYHFGGLFITRGGPESHVSMINQLQALSEVPMLVAINAEWGLGQTMDSTLSFQKPLVLSALANDSLVYATGAEIARQLKILGIHINFAPHADIDIPSENSPIALRYFSNDKKRVANKSVAFMKGLQEHGVIACAKHLPAEEKNTLPDQNQTEAISFDLNRLDTLDFYPYQQLINEGLGGMLTTHLHFSAAEKKGLVPASISEIFISEILKKKTGFKGLTFTEIPYLQSAAGKKRAGETELLAFRVGNDILISPLKPREAIRKIMKAMKKNPMLKSQLEVSVKKILEAKYAVGLASSKTVSPDNLASRLTSDEAIFLKHQIAKATVTVVRNASSSIPIKILDNKRFASLTVGKGEQNEFNHYLAKYADLRYHSVLSISDTLGLNQKLRQADVVIISLFPSLITKEISSFIKQLASTREVILCNFGSPFLLNDFEGLPTIIEAYTEEAWMPKLAAQVIFGGVSAEGVLPINAGSLPIGQGLKTSALGRLEYTLPLAAGMDNLTLNKIKFIAQEAIDSGATPGCHVLIAKDGKVVFEQSFGSLTYENKISVTDETIFDLASLTKVTATLQAVMFMYEKGLIDINKKISVYLSELKESNKKDFVIKDILTHQAGLWPFLPFWAQTVKESQPLPEYYSSTASEDYPFPVADNLFASKNMKDSLWQWIINAKVREKPDRTPYDYRYSDMGFYMLQHLAEKLLNQPMDDFLAQNLYEPIGSYTTGYLPLKQFPAERIAPTEDDKLFRRSLLRGYVHDQGAAMQGGIAGHAGLFSTANDLAKLGQLWLQKGSYGGLQIFKPETLEFFTQKQYENSRRGLGWDKPVLSDPSGPTSLYSSQKTFGHTGFTGTCIWVDPEFNLVYVFLSNRVYPDMNNNKLLNANIRPRIQDVIYQSIFNHCIHN